MGIFVEMSKQVGSEVIVVLQNQFRDKIAENVQRFLSKVDKRRLGDSAMGAASTNLIMSMNRAGNWYTASLEKVIKREVKEAEIEKKRLKAPRAPNLALSRKYVLTDTMAELIGTPSASRPEVIKRVYVVHILCIFMFRWAYVRENELKDASGKIRLDSRLRSVLGNGDEHGLVRNTEIMKFVAPHLLHPE